MQNPPLPCCTFHLVLVIFLCLYSRILVLYSTIIRSTGAGRGIPPGPASNPALSGESSGPGTPATPLSMVGSLGGGQTPPTMARKDSNSSPAHTMQSQAHQAQAQAHSQSQSQGQSLVHQPAGTLKIRFLRKFIFFCANFGLLWSGSGAARLVPSRVLGVTRIGPFLGVF